MRKSNAHILIFVFLLYSNCSIAYENCVEFYLSQNETVKLEKKSIFPFNPKYYLPLSSSNFFSEVYVDPTKTRIVDPNDPKFFGHENVVISASGVLLKIPGFPTKRGLGIELNLKYPDGGRIDGLTGKYFYSKILEHFKGRFHAINAHWTTALPDNLIEFNKLTAPPYSLPPEKAALKTWSGKMAAKLGFTEVEFLHLKGEPGNYTSVALYFLNPEIPL